jgi:adenylylsulfate kinase-like enzyme
VDVPLAVAEQRDTKGLYQKARSGALSHLTGIDSPYEPPLAPDLALRTDRISIDACVDRLLTLLETSQDATAPIAQHAAGTHPGPAAIHAPQP